MQLTKTSSKVRVHGIVTSPCSELVNSVSHWSFASCFDHVSLFPFNFLLLLGITCAMHHGFLCVSGSANVIMPYTACTVLYL